MVIFEKDVIKNTIVTFEQKVNNSKIKKIEASNHCGYFFVDYYDIDIPKRDYYVYRHYYYTKDEREITFYVGKGRGTRAFIASYPGRSEMWCDFTKGLNKYYIDIVEIFESEDDAFNFEKELMGYYYLLKDECYCNGGVKSACIVIKEKMLTAQLSLFMDENIEIDELFWFFRMLYSEYIHWGNKYLAKEINKILKNKNSKYLIHRIEDKETVRYIYK